MGQWEEKSGKTVDRITNSRTFEPFSKPVIGCRFFVFRQIGESVEGFLGPAIINWYRSQSYPIKQENDEIVEVFANKLLHRIIEKNDLIGSFVKIEYVGRQFTGYGHARKIYRVYKNKSATRYDWEFVAETEKKLKQLNERKVKQGA